MGLDQLISDFSHQSALEDIPHDVLSSAALYKVPVKELNLWSDVVTSTGVLGEELEINLTDSAHQLFFNP